MDKKYRGLSEEQFDAINTRYNAFHAVINDPTKDPVKVFEPLSKKSLEELILIREVSKDLQIKKEEDIKKAAQNQVNTKESEEPEQKEQEKAE